RSRSLSPTTGSPTRASARPTPRTTARSSSSWPSPSRTAEAPRSAGERLPHGCPPHLGLRPVPVRALVEQLAGGLDERAVGGEGERSPHRDAPHPGGGQLGHRRARRPGRPV